MMKTDNEIQITLEDFKRIKSFYPRFTRKQGIETNDCIIGWSELMPVVEKIKQLRDFDAVTDGKHNRDPYFAEQKPLCLTLKSKWYDMIDAKIKKEEYREINPYWAKRLLMDVSFHISVDDFSVQRLCELIIEGSDLIAYDFTWSKGDQIRFARGGHFHPSIPQMYLECDGINIGTGKPEWGAEPGKKYFVIKLGERIS